MAQIHTSIDEDQHHVVVRGRLLARDVRRLELACGRALERRDLRLTVTLEAASLPPSAREFLHRLLARGALVIGPDGEWPALPEAGDARGG